MIITNGLDEKQTFAAKLTKFGEDCDEACFITAFYTQEQQVKILNLSGKKVRLTVSLRPPTCPRALRETLLLPNVSVRFMGRELHSKIYAFEQGDKNSLSGAKYNVAIGSSNMTNGGLYNNIETNILLEGKQAEEGYSQAEQIFKLSNLLTSDVLDRYEEEFSAFEKPQFNDIIASPAVLDAGYERVQNAVKYVAKLCEDEISLNFSDVPKSFVIDHFWHFIVEEKRSDKEYLRQQTVNGPSESLTKALFDEFILWDQAGEQYCRQMLERSHNLKSLLSSRSLNETQLKELYLTFHASRYVDERYTGKAEAFARRNTSKQVLNSLRHLANEAIPVSERVADLQRGEFSLHGLGESAIKEFNGWYYPNKYPIWNKKSDRALEILGFG
ncbi:phospholipase D-like domain-containing protein [Vibrio crassostreae]|uniref:phospholipase D-like domain-containing protein n=1 Tax=Vibrio crassostreae TaxID=246167 RepID=UPI001B301E9F|nr:phospholipase D family protein [Vibrio crassostreae]CAK2715322.1 Phospholipase D-like domain-containing protein [Vibrio crassostreae]